MLIHLIEKEILEIFKTVKFLVAFAAYVILIPLALYTGQAQYQSRLTSFQESLTTYQRGLTGQKGSLEIRPQALYRPSKLSVFARDMIPYIPAGFVLSPEDGVKIEAGRIPPAVSTKFFGDFDLIFVITVVVSLLSMLTMSDAVSGEKERGTLRMLLSLPIPKSKLFLAKYLGALTASTLTLLVAFLAGLVVILAVGGVTLDGDLLGTLGVVFLVVVLYCSASLLLGLVASTFTHRATNSLLIAILLWLSLVVVAPRLGLMAAEKLFPIDSPETLSLKEELLRKDIADRQVAELREIFNREDYATAREPIVSRYRKELADRLEEVEESYLRSRAAQERWALRFGALSPATHLTYAVTELTETGFGAVRRLLRDVRLYGSTIAEDVYSQGFQDQIPNAGVRMEFQAVDLSELPRFSQTTAGFPERLASSAVAIAALAVFNLVLFALAYAKGLAYDPR